MKHYYICDIAYYICDIALFFIKTACNLEPVFFKINKQQATQGAIVGRLAHYQLWSNSQGMFVLS